MRFVLLGLDEEFVRLLTAVHSSAGAELVAAYDCQRELLGLPQPGPEVPVLSVGDWEALLHEPNLDGVIVGRKAVGDEPEEQLKKLVQAGVSLIVPHPACEMLLAFELQMIQRDSGSAIVPYFPGMHHPLFAQVGAWIENPVASPLGEVKQLIFDRGLPAGTPQEGWPQFARDVYVLRQLLRTINRVGALGTDRQREVNWSNLSVQMSNAKGVLARWSSRHVNGPATGELTVLAEAGKAVCRLSGDVADWQLQIIEPTEETVVVAPDRSESATLQVFSGSQAGDRTADQMWEVACRALELVEVVSESYRRGKTIDIHLEQVTEEGTFKSMMAAGGCLLMLLILLLLPVLAFFDTVTASFRSPSVPQRTDGGRAAEGSAGGAQSPFLDEQRGDGDGRLGRAFEVWPQVLLVGLILFLALQFLRLVYRRSPRPPDTNQT